MSGIRIARVSGIPIHAHVTLLIVLPLMAMNMAQAASLSFAWGLAGAVGFFASIALHELGHSWVALRKGCRVREIMLLPIGGVAQLDRMPARPRDEILVSLAGPAVSLGLFGASRLLAVPAAEAGFHSAQRMLVLLGGTNLLLALFNLLPSFPMDGGRIFRAWLTPRLGYLGATRIASGVGRFMAVLFGVLALRPFNPVLLVIALFIHQAAGAEYRMAQHRESARAWPPFSPSSGAGMGSENEITVGPPPYARGSSTDPSSRTPRDRLGDLFKRWR